LSDFEITWLDRGRPPRQPPNPDYPEGIDLDLSDGAEQNCTVKLPYPSEHKNIGTYIVICRRCGLRVGITTAARADDPRSAKLACKETRH
jgi:hypothetical protein